MKTFDIKLGKGRNALTLDAGKLIDRCALIQGGRDSGKSYLARVIVEQTIAAGLQTIILDPEGEFSTLREKCNILIAGEEGDVPTEPRSAKLLARRIAETGVSTVIDLSGLKPQERYEFAQLFLDTFDQLPKKLQKRPRLFVMDEAHLYCPEAGKGKASCAESVVVLMSQGRKRGHGTILITQRLSKLRKDAANECGTFFIGNTAPTDLNTAADVLGITKKERDALRNLPAGTFWAAGSGVGNVMQFQARRAQTTHPQPGSRHGLATPPAPTAIKRILKEFEELPPPKAEEEAQNLAQAKTEIARLEKELSRRQAAQGPEARHLAHQVARLEKALAKAQSQAERALDAGIERERKRLSRTLQKFPGVLRALAKRPLADAPQALEDAAQALEDALKPPEPRDLSLKALGLQTGRTKTDKPNLVATPQNGRPKRKLRKTYVESAGDTFTPHYVEELPFTWNSAPGKLFAVLVQYGGESLEHRRMAALAGVNFRSSTMRNALTKLRQVPHLVVEGNKTMSATSRAIEDYGDQVEPLPSGEELLEAWRSRLGNGVPCAIFNAIIDFGGVGSKDEICTAAGTDARKSTARNAFTKLRHLGLLEDSGPDTLKLSEEVLEAISN